MSSSSRRAVEAGPAVSRRRLLGAGAAVAALATATVTGCTFSDPRISSDGQPPPSPSPSSPRSSTPTPTPSAAAARAFATSEQELANLAGAILGGPHRAQLSASRRQLLTAIRDAHRQHVASARSPQPTTRPAPPAATASAVAPAGFRDLSLAESEFLLVKKEKAQSTRGRKAATAATGFDALLCGSMGVAAGSFAAALVVDGAVPTSVASQQHRPVGALSDVEALQTMVRQLHAAVYGYQLALGRLSPSSAGGARAILSLQAHRRLRDALEEDLIARSATVPAAEPAYVPSVKPTTAAKAAALIQRMEIALQPFCGLWLASATTSAARTLALDTLTSTVATARSWDAPVTAWPGWQD